MGNKGAVVRLDADCNTSFIQVGATREDSRGTVLYSIYEIFIMPSFTLPLLFTLQYEAAPHPPVKPMAYASGMQSMFGL